MMTENEVRQLIIDYKLNKNQLAFEELLSEFEGYIKSLSFKLYIKGGDEDDLKQVAAIGLLKGISTFDISKENTNSIAFIKMSISRYAKTEVSGALRYKHAFISDSARLEQSVARYGKDKECVELAELIPTENNLEKDIMIKETLAEVENILRNSSDMQYRVYTLFMKGYTYKDISEVTGYSMKQIDNSLQRVKGKIRKNINLEEFKMGA